MSVARAMRAFGWTDWVAVSEPRYLDGMLDVLKQHRSPEQSDAFVGTLRRVDTLADAVADCSFVVGTTMRTLPGRPRFSTPQLVAEVAARGDASWALVFGPESHGLQDADLAQCHAMSFVPSDDAQPSLNLSQAVVVYAHALAGRAERASRALAGDALLRELEKVVAEGLWARAFPSAALPELFAPLLRAGLTDDEVRAWMKAWSPEP